MAMGDYSPGSVWYYAPNKAAPIVFIILFFVSGVIHAYQTIIHKSYRTTLLLPWAALLMLTGFTLRLAGSYTPTSLAYLIASTVLIMSGPPVYALINYLILSRILYYIPYLAPLHPGRIATTFIGLDGVCEVLIGNGAWRMANSSLTDDERDVGKQMVMASLCLQSLLFGAFGFLTAMFHVRADIAGVLSKDLRAVLWVLYISAGIITIRCIYRLVEYILGWQSPIYTNEVYFWIFEASIMFVNTALLNLYHRGKRLPKSNDVFLARDGVTERKGPGWKDDRPWIITIFDPFDLWDLFRGRDKETQFWDMTDEELERVRLEKEAEKRSWWQGLLDPFHLWGNKGYIQKWRRGMADFDTGALIITYAMIGMALTIGLTYFILHLPDLARCCFTLLKLCCPCIPWRQQRQPRQERNLQQATGTPQPAHEQRLSTAVTLVDGVVPGQPVPTGDIEMVDMSEAERRGNEDDSDLSTPARHSPQTADRGRQ
ncbi:hypothetical protein LEMA_P101220.1 [Plenodomus lingam JN3]|uniref:RTA1 domain protein n=3 Tax=Leptosphaeria maculans TaxID=5022 RepID=E5A0D1_LEPMJ|nr:hypothetical protein LEMA_P101220.1 [Plenodomus lingam JN3]CBX96991.1 hypothetical protein LEMA_P101220.1 [Plenodomus lingam JN3]